MCNSSSTVATWKPLETNGFQIKEALKYKKTCVKFQMMNEFHDARKKKVVHKVVVNLFALVVCYDGFSINQQQQRR